MATGTSQIGSHTKPLTTPTSYCVRYAGNGSKRWDGKTIFVDANTLLDSYNYEELVPGKEISITWKTKSKGIVQWKAIIVDTKPQEEQDKEKEPPRTGNPPSNDKEPSRRGRKRKAGWCCIYIS